MLDTEIEVIPGLAAGHRHVPVDAAGAYVPGGRYSQIASAIMTVTTAKVAGVSHTACSPPRPGIGVPPAILYTMGLRGAHRVLSLGGVQGVAAMAFGLFGCPKANILAGPGNRPHFAAGGHGGPRPHLRYPAEEKLSRGKLRFDRGGIDRAYINLEPAKISFVKPVPLGDHQST